MPIHLSGMLGELAAKSVSCRTILYISWCGVVKGADEIQVSKVSENQYSVLWEGDTRLL